MHLLGDKICRLVGKRVIHILVTDSTHNFLNEETRSLGCVIAVEPSREVYVADANKLNCRSSCKGFQWAMQDRHSESDKLLISLSSCDAILALQWLRTLGHVVWDFKEMTMQFEPEGDITLINILFGLTEMRGKERDGNEGIHVPSFG